jgi:hypothetical protein
MNFEYEFLLKELRLKDFVEEVEKDRLVREVKSLRRKRKPKLPLLKLKSKSPERFSFQN